MVRRKFLEYLEAETQSLDEPIFFNFQMAVMQSLQKAKADQLAKTEQLHLQQQTVPPYQQPFPFQQQQSSDPLPHQLISVCKVEEIM